MEEQESLAAKTNSSLTPREMVTAEYPHLPVAVIASHVDRMAQELDCPAWKAAWATANLIENGKLDMKGVPAADHIAALRRLADLYVAQAKGMDLGALPKIDYAEPAPAGPAALTARRGRPA